MHFFSDTVSALVEYLQETLWFVGLLYSTIYDHQMTSLIPWKHTIFCPQHFIGKSAVSINKILLNSGIKVQLPNPIISGYNFSMY